MIRTKILAAGFGLLFILPFGCHPGTGITGATGGGGATAGGAYGSGLCGLCVVHACATEDIACMDDPKCVAYLACLNACPTNTADGDADPACANACLGAPDGAPRPAIDAYNACRTSGLGANCATCGIAGGGDAGLPNWDWILHQQCPASTESNACYRCEDEHCCQTHADFEGDAAAQAYRTCVQGCQGTPSCVLECAEQGPDGVKHFAERLACVAFFCADADTCGDVPLAPCLACLHQNCASQFVAVDAEPDGFLFQACASPCAASDGACFDACAAKYPGGAPLYQALGKCGQDQCATECTK
jgi:hypothetical protein